MRSGTRIIRVHSFFRLRMNRSMSAILPCWPTAPKRGLIPLRSHQSLNTVHQNCWPLSQIIYFGAEPALTMAQSRKVSAVCLSDQPRAARSSSTIRAIESTGCDPEGGPKESVDQDTNGLSSPRRSPSGSSGISGATTPGCSPVHTRCCKWSARYLGWESVAFARTHCRIIRFPAFRVSVPSVQFECGLNRGNCDFKPDPLRFVM